MTLFIYHSGTNLGLYITTYENTPISYLSLCLLVMNVLALRTLDAETKIVIVALLRYSLPVVSLLHGLFLFIVLLLTHLLL